MKKTLTALALMSALSFGAGTAFADKKIVYDAFILDGAPIGFHLGDDGWQDFPEYNPKNVKNGLERYLESYDIKKNGVFNVFFTKTCGGDSKVFRARVDDGKIVLDDNVKGFFKSLDNGHTDFTKISVKPASFYFPSSSNGRGVYKVGVSSDDGFVSASKSIGVVNNDLMFGDVSSVDVKGFLSDYVANGLVSDLQGSAYLTVNYMYALEKAGNSNDVGVSALKLFGDDLQGLVGQEIELFDGTKRVLTQEDLYTSLRNHATARGIAKVYEARQNRGNQWRVDSNNILEISKVRKFLHETPVGNLFCFNTLIHSNSNYSLHSFKDGIEKKLESISGMSVDMTQLDVFDYNMSQGVEKFYGEVIKK